MKSKKYRKYRAGKHSFRTKQIQGSGGKKGENIPGHKAARVFLEKKHGVDLSNAVLQANRFQWVFCLPR